jgi:uncharacterized protein
MRILIIFFLMYLLYRLVRGAMGLKRPGPPPVRDGRGEVIDEMVQDPNCGTYVPRNDAVRRRLHGQDLYFCSETCAEEYTARNR